MKDDSLNDVAYCCTVEGMHETAKREGFKAWSIGCSCDECNEEFDKLLRDIAANDPRSLSDSVGKQPNAETVKVLAEADATTSVYGKEIWNAAIDKVLEIWDDIGPNETDIEIGERFKGLKK